MSNTKEHFELPHTVELPLTSELPRLVRGTHGTQMWFELASNWIPRSSRGNSGTVNNPIRSNYPLPPNYRGLTAVPMELKCGSNYHRTRYRGQAAVIQGLYHD